MAKKINHKRNLKHMTKLQWLIFFSQHDRKDKQEGRKRYSKYHIKVITGSHRDIMRVRAIHMRDDSVDNLSCDEILAHIKRRVNASNERF